MSWSNHDRDWKNANSIFKWGFRGRRCLGISNYLLLFHDEWGSVVGNTVNSRLADTSLLRTPRKYGQPLNPRRKLQTFDWNKLPLLRTLAITDLRTPLGFNCQFYCSNSRYNGHPSVSFDILTELSQNLFLLIFSSSLLLWLKSEHFDSRLTWSFYETTIGTCKKQSWCT